MTDAEVRLWLRLRTLRPEGFHFRRQSPFRGYILDFVCFDRRLAVELDGGHHSEDSQAAHDATRDAVLRREGFEVLRFSNRFLSEDIRAVMYTILCVLHERPSVRETRRRA